MDDRDTAALMADIRRAMQAKPGLSVLLIEHDRRLLGERPDRVVVSGSGQKVAKGDCAVVRPLPRVQQADPGQRAVDHAGACECQHLLWRGQDAARPDRAGGTRDQMLAEDSETGRWVQVPVQAAECRSGVCSAASTI